MLQVLMLCGPKGVGKSTLVSLLASDHGGRVRWVQLLTTKPCYNGEEDSGIMVTPLSTLVRFRFGFRVRVRVRVRDLVSSPPG